MEAMAPQLVRENSMSAKLKAGHEETLGLVLQTTSVRAGLGWIGLLIYHKSVGTISTNQKVQKVTTYQTSRIT